MSRLYSGTALQVRERYFRIAYIYIHQATDFLRSQGIMPREIVSRPHAAVQSRPASVLSARARSTPGPQGLGSTPPRETATNAQKKEKVPVNAGSNVSIMALLN